MTSNNVSSNPEIAGDPSCFLPILIKNEYYSIMGYLGKYNIILFFKSEW